MIYRPQTERISQYFETCRPEQFDALLHDESTRAVEPLERTGLWEHVNGPPRIPRRCSGAALPAVAIMRGCWSHGSGRVSSPA